jgi:hypothetical protein
LIGTDVFLPIPSGDGVLFAARSFFHRGRAYTTPYVMYVSGVTKIRMFWCMRRCSERELHPAETSYCSEREKYLSEGRA